MSHMTHLHSGRRTCIYKHVFANMGENISDMQAGSFLWRLSNIYSLMSCTVLALMYILYIYIYSAPVSGSVHDMIEVSVLDNIPALYVQLCT